MIGQTISRYRTVEKLGGGGTGVLAELGGLQAAVDLADLQGDFPYRGFSLRPDGKSFLTSVLTAKGDLWLLQDFDRRTGWLNHLLRRP